MDVRLDVEGPIGYVTDLEGNVDLWHRFIECLGCVRNCRVTV